MKPNYSPSRKSGLNRWILACLVLVFASPLMQAEERSAMQSLDLKMPFIENQGQRSDEVLFYSPTASGTVFVTKEGEIVYALPDADSNGRKKGWSLRETLVGASLSSIQGADRVSTTLNFFLGDDAEKWQSLVPAYNCVKADQVYKGIDLVLHTTSKEVEKCFYLEPDADPSKIRIRISGAQSLEVNPDGTLELSTGLGIVKFTQPKAWQEDGGQENLVDVAYHVEGDVYSFSLGEYDKGKLLIIDPMLASTFHGGLDEDCGLDSVLGHNNDIYVGGYTASDPFPVTPGAYNESYSGGALDAFVARFDRDLSTLLACTYLGGSGDEGWFYLGLAMDADGNLFVTGNTSTSDFPTSPGAYDETYAGGPASGPYGTGGDQFITKLSGDLSTLVASTFLGGSGYEYCRAMVLDNQGNVYVGGSTSSTNFPASPGAYDETPHGNGDAYVACLDNSLSTRIAASYLGGAESEFIEVIDLDENGNLFVTGWTRSQNFPTPNGYYPTYNGGMYDAFVSKFSGDLTSLPGSSYLGGSQWDFGYAMDLDADGNVFVGGHAGKNFPTTTGAYCETYNGNLGQNYGDDVFVTKFDNSLGNVLVSTYLGGNKWENASFMVVDEEGHLYIAGTTSSTNYPAPPGSYDRVYNGGIKHNGDFFITRLNNGLTELLASTYIGGASADGGYTLSLELEPGGDIFLTSETASTDFPMTPGAADPTYNGGDSDVVIFKIDRALTADPSLHADADTISAGTGGTIALSLDPGVDYADRTYLILGTATGVEPGFLLPGGLMNMPINWDAFTDICLMFLNTVVFTDFYGTLDSSGLASAQISSGPLPSGIGTVMHYAFALNDPFDFASNAVRIEVIP